MEFRESFVHDDTDCVIKDTLPKDHRIELGVNFVLVEYGKDRHWVSG